MSTTDPRQRSSAHDRPAAPHRQDLVDVLATALLRLASDPHPPINQRPQHAMPTDSPQAPSKARSPT